MKGKKWSKNWEDIYYYLRVFPRSLLGHSCFQIFNQIPSPYTDIPLNSLLHVTLPIQTLYLKNYYYYMQYYWLTNLIPSVPPHLLENSPGCPFVPHVTSKLSKRPTKNFWTTLFPKWEITKGTRWIKIAKIPRKME